MKYVYLAVKRYLVNNTKQNIFKGAKFFAPFFTSNTIMSANFHPVIYLIDYVMGVIMWTLIGRVAMNIFQREDSSFFFMRVFVKLTDPLINIFKIITPSFIIKPLVPLYVAWFFYMFRFYLFPYLLGYSVMGMLSFPLESEIAIQIYQIFGKK